MITNTNSNRNELAPSNNGVGGGLRSLPGAITNVQSAGAAAAAAAGGQYQVQQVSYGLPDYTSLKTSPGDGLDRSNHVISSQSSVASANTSNASANSNFSGIMGGLPQPLAPTGIQGMPAGQPASSAGQGTGQVSENSSVVKKEDEGVNSSNADARAPVAIANNPTNLVDTNTTSKVEGNKSPLVLQLNAPPHPVAEFLFQLTKMLTDNNSEYIEWSNASIYVHDPPGLEKNILPKYFRHANYSSFQRQMNYFGFRKIAGKGKMAPCSYVNENATEDISSLLYIKRKKTGMSGTAAKLMAQRNQMNLAMSMGAGALGQVGQLGQLGQLGGPLGQVGQGQYLLGANGLGAGATLGAGTSNLVGMGQFGVPNNQSIPLHGIQGMGGVVGGVGAGAGTGGMNVPPSTNPQESNRLREQQQMLAQLQQAHASASASANLGGTPATGTSLGLAPQQKFGQGFNGGLMGAPAPILTNDQGAIYTSATAKPEYLPPAPNNGASNTQAPSQSFLMGGNFAQANGPTSGDMNNMNRSNSAANLRALINQQISLYSSPSSTGLTAPPGVYTTNLNAFQPSCMGQPAQVTSAPQSFVPMAPNSGSVNQSIPYDFLVQQTNGAGPNSFNLNGYLGSGVTGGAQGFSG